MNIHNNNIILVVICLSLLFSSSNDAIIQETNNANQDSTLRYTVNNGPVHQWIALQAYYKLTNPDLIYELGLYLQTEEENPVLYSGDQQGNEFVPPDGWYQFENAPYESATALIEGTWEEDNGEFLPELLFGLSLRSFFHFWNPDENYDSGINLDIFALGIQPSALSTAQARFYQAIANYNIGDLANAYYWLGRTAHLLMDMSVPAHVQLDMHIPFGDLDSDNYEMFIGSWEFHYKHVDSSSPNTYPPTPPFSSSLRWMCQYTLLLSFFLLVLSIGIIFSSSAKGTGYTLFLSIQAMR